MDHPWPSDPPPHSSAMSGQAHKSEQIPDAINLKPNETQHPPLPTLSDKENHQAPQLVASLHLEAAPNSSQTIANLKDKHEQQMQATASNPQQRNAKAAALERTSAWVRDQTYAAGSAIVQPNILSQNFNNGPVLQQHSLVDRQKNNIAIQRHNPYSRLTSFHHSRSTRGGRNTAHNQPPQSRQAFMSNGVAQIYPASGNTTQFPTTIGNESTPDLGSGYLSTSTVVMQPSAGGVSNPQQVPIRRSASMSISQSQPPLGNIVRVHSYVGLNPSEFATGGVAHDEATTAYSGSRWPQPQLLPSQNIEKPSIYSNIGHFYGRNLVQPSSRNSIPPTKQATTVDANAQYIWIPDAITNISSQPLAGSAGSSQSTTHFSRSYQIDSGNAYQLSQSLAGGTAPSQPIAYFSRPYQGGSGNASQNEVQLPQDGDEPLSTQPVGNTLPAQQSFTAPQVTGNGSTAVGVAQNPSLFGSGTAFPAHLFPWEGKTVLDPNCSQCYPNRDNTVLSGNDNKTNDSTHPVPQQLSNQSYGTQITYSGHLAYPQPAKPNSTLNVYDGAYEHPPVTQQLSDLSYGIQNNHNGYPGHQQLAAAYPALNVYDGTHKYTGKASSVETPAVAPNNHNLPVVKSLSNWVNGAEQNNDNGGFRYLQSSSIASALGGASPAVQTHVSAPNPTDTQTGYTGGLGYQQTANLMPSLNTSVAQDGSQLGSQSRSAAQNNHNSDVPGSQQQSTFDALLAANDEVFNSFFSLYKVNYSK